MHVVVRRLRSDMLPKGARAEEQRRKWSWPVLAKYWACQLPATAIVVVVLVFLRQNFALPYWAVWSAVAAWVFKDALLYHLLWRSYDPDYPAAGPYRMEGAQGRAVERIDPAGAVMVSGEFWRAELAEGARHIEKGERVRVHRRSGLTLYVKSEDS